MILGERVTGESVSESGIPMKIEGVHVAISGIHEEDDFVKDVVRKEVVNSIKKILRMSRITDFSAHVKKADDEGKRARFDVLIQVMAEKGSLHADGSEWDLPKAMRKALDNLEREVYKEEDKSKDTARAF